MNRLAAVQHAAALGAGVLYAVWKGDWVFVEIQLLAQGGVLFFCYVFPEWFGRPSPREREAEAIRLEENRIAKQALR
jgi:hypothetical protein